MCHCVIEVIDDGPILGRADDEVTDQLPATCSMLRDIGARQERPIFLSRLGCGPEARCSPTPHLASFGGDDESFRIANPVPKLDDAEILGGQ